MSKQEMIGARLRERRLDLGLRQADLAQSVGISPSYLNLIEHNRRRIGGKLLADLARELGADPATLAKGADDALLEQMRSAAAAAGQPVELARAEELAARYPGWSALIAAQARRAAQLETRIQAMSDRVAYDPHLAQSLHDMISTVTAIRSSASILVGQEQIDADWQRRFHQNIDTDSRRLAASSEALMAYLESPQTDEFGTFSPLEQRDAYLLANRFYLPALEAPDADIAAFVAAAALPAPAAAVLAEYARTYHADAQALPRAAFAAACRDAGYDPLPVARQFDVAPMRVIRRMASLTEDEGHPPTGFAACDAAGAISVLKPGHDFTLPRFGNCCPLWPLFAAFARPQQPLRKTVTLPGTTGSPLLCYAVAAPVAGPSFAPDAALQAVMLVVSAPQPLAEAPAPVGLSCRICARRGCDSRREPAAAQIDEQL